MFARHQSALPRQGAVAVKVAVMLPMLMGIIALSFDGGMIYDTRRQSQATADAAALAAAAELFQTYYNLDAYDDGLDPYGIARQKALAVAAGNGYPNDGKTASVVVNIPPQSGPRIGEPGTVEVLITYFQPRAFSGIFGSGPIPIGARAVARGRWYPPTFGILILDPTAPGALTISGGAIGQVPNASVIVNSSSPSAATANNSATMTASSFDVTGGIVGTSQFIGTQNTGVLPTPDPFKKVPQPDPASMLTQSTNKLPVYSSNPSPPPSFNYTVTNPVTGVTTVYLQPGYYRGGMSYTQGNVVLNPGVYYIDGGGFKFSGQGSLTATEVMIFNDPGNNNGSVSVSGQGTVNWTPPGTGVYAGMSLFQKRGATTTVSISGQGGMTIQGVMYVPDALLDISGNGLNYIANQMVVSQLRLTGNGTYIVPWEASKLKRVREMRIVE